MQQNARHWPQYLGAFAVLILLAGVASASAALLQLQQVTDTFNELSVEVDSEAKDGLADVPAGKPQTILLIGSDKRSKKSADGQFRSGALSDTLMLARMDPDSGATAVMSIPRDTKAQIPLKGGGFRTAKINEAYADGGEALTIRTVRKLMGLPINHVVIVNFNAFQRAVNYFGGLYPSDPLDTPAQKLAFIARNGGPGLHYTGTCSAGRDPRSSVVDGRFRVWGVSGLRVVDASVIPEMPAVNIHASVLTVAQLAARVLVAEQRLGQRLAETA